MAGGYGSTVVLARCQKGGRVAGKKNVHGPECGERVGDAEIVLARQKKGGWQGTSCRAQQEALLIGLKSTFCTDTSSYINVLGKKAGM
eukprot:1157646-Pelagomonas_calceolata.AAC.1